VGRERVEDFRGAPDIGAGCSPSGASCFRENHRSATGVLGQSGCLQRSKMGVLFETM
jgi:hypothetical protein